MRYGLVPVLIVVVAVLIVATHTPIWLLLFVLLALLLL